MKNFCRSLSCSLDFKVCTSTNLLLLDAHGPGAGRNVGEEGFAVVSSLLTEDVQNARPCSTRAERRELLGSQNLYETNELRSRSSSRVIRFVLTGPALGLRRYPTSSGERDPFLYETSVPGVFAVGDVRAHSVKRVASAVGEGSVAVQFVHQHLRS